MYTKTQNVAISEDNTKTVSINKTMQAYAEIKELIITGKLKAETPLRESTLSEMLNISRTPIREALRLLETERFVFSTPNKGVCVSKLTCSDALDIMNARIGLETYAVKLLVKNMDEKKIESLEKCLQAQKDLMKGYDHITYAAYDRLFHRIIMSGADNIRLMEFWDTLNDSAQRLLTLMFSKSNRVAISISKHEQLLKLIKDRDADKVCTLLEEHVQNAKDAIISILLMEETQ